MHPLLTHCLMFIFFQCFGEEEKVITHYSTQISKLKCCIWQTSSKAVLVRDFCMSHVEKKSRKLKNNAYSTLFSLDTDHEIYTCTTSSNNMRRKPRTDVVGIVPKDQPKPSFGMPKVEYRELHKTIDNLIIFKCPNEISCH